VGGRGGGGGGGEKTFGGQVKKEVLDGRVGERWRRRPKRKGVETGRILPRSVPALQPILLSGFWV
jgi:hypothetical protein